VYVLTEAGREILPVLGALARFGAHRLPAPADDTVVKPRAAPEPRIAVGSTRSGNAGIYMLSAVALIIAAVKILKSP